MFNSKGKEEKMGERKRIKEDSQLRHRVPKTEAPVLKLSAAGLLL